MPIVETIKHHKLSIILAAALLFWITKDSFYGMNISSRSRSYSRSESYSNLAMPTAGGGVTKSMAVADVAMPNPRLVDAAPTNNPNRMVIQDTDLSMVVKSVEQTLLQIETIATQNGGYMVNTSLSRPDNAATGYITIRVASSKRTEALKAIKAAGLKVINEHVSGYDVTDQYADLQAQLDNLNTVKAKFEAILNDATRVPDILEVTRELQNIQNQIDAVKGQQQYLEKTAELTKISIHLSTDELALPYAPDNAWRPEVIVKQAIRSLIGTARSLGTALIWIAIYTPVWGLALLVWFLWRKRTPQKKA